MQNAGRSRIAVTPGTVNHAVCQPPTTSAARRSAGTRAEEQWKSPRGPANIPRGLMTRILIVADSLDSRILVEEMLVSAGMDEVVHATSAIDAFRHLGVATPVPPGNDIDLILLDIELPGLDGILACRRIRRIR